MAGDVSQRLIMEIGQVRPNAFVIGKFDSFATGDPRADERNDAEKVETVYDKPNVFERAGMAGI